MTTGNDIVEAAQELVDRGLLYGSPTSPIHDDHPTQFDCSGFVAWIVHRMADASVGTTSSTTGQYTFCRDAGCELLPVEEAYTTPGALLFRNPIDGPRPHVAVSVGDGAHTLEAMGSDQNPRGVCQGNVNPPRRGWTHAALIPGVDYGKTASIHDADCLLDTRPGSRLGYAGAKPGPGATVRIPVADADPPPDAVAVMLNVTALKGTGDGFVTVFPSGLDRPTTSNLNVDLPGRDTATALATVPIGADGTVSVYTQSGVHVLAHLARWFRAGQGFTPLVPTRLLDTRNGGQAPGPGATIEVPILGRGDVPSEGVGAAVLTVTGVDARSPGYVTVWPAGLERPRASNLNLDSPRPRANQVIVPLGDGGAVSLFTQSGAHLVVDLSGWFAVDGVFRALSPTRILDTRPDSAVGHPGGRPGPRSAVAFQVLGAGGIPTDGVREVVLNVTATNTVGAGSVAIWPSGQPARTAPIVSITAAGQTVPNLAIVPVGTDGRVVLGTQGGADLIADVVGWTSG